MTFKKVYIRTGLNQTLMRVHAFIIFSNWSHVQWNKRKIKIACGAKYSGLPALNRYIIESVWCFTKDYKTRLSIKILNFWNQNKCLSAFHRAFIYGVCFLFPNRVYNTELIKYGRIKSTMFTKLAYTWDTFIEVHHIRMLKQIT